MLEGAVRAAGLLEDNMALNIPMPESPGTSLLQGLDTGSTLFSRMIQPVIERERLKQAQDQFVQNLALQKQGQARQNALLPYMIQQYQDTHRTAASDAQFKEMYRKIIENAGSANNAPQGPPQVGGPPPSSGVGGMSLIGGGDTNPIQTLPAQGSDQPAMGAPVSQPSSNQLMSSQEQELRSGNPRLSQLDRIAGLVPGVPKPVTHFSNGMLFTSYPSGRMTVQKVQGVQTPGQLNVNAKEGSKIRDQATALINSANLVQQGYDLLDTNDDLTGIGSGAAQMLNLSNNPELGKFTTVTGKLQAELGKYAASRGGIQAVKWAGSVKPSSWKPEDYNYGMFEGIQRNLQDDYNTLNQQYKAVTGQDLPVSLPNMKNTKGAGGNKGKGKAGTANSSEAKPDFIRVNGKLVRAR